DATHHHASIDQPAGSSWPSLASHEGWGKCRPLDRPPPPVAGAWAWWRACPPALDNPSGCPHFPQPGLRNILHQGGGHRRLLTLTDNRIRPGVAPLRPCPLWTGLGVRFQLDSLFGFAGMRNRGLLALHL